MGNTLNNKKANGLALLPFLVFIVVYMGAGLVYQSKGVDMAFYQFPSVTAMFLAVLVAFIMFKGSINEKFDTFAKGAANVDVLTMLIIYILAGAFATVAAEMGGRRRYRQPGPEPAFPSSSWPLACSSSLLSWAPLPVLPWAPSPPSLPSLSALRKRVA